MSSIVLCYGLRSGTVQYGSPFLRYIVFEEDGGDRAVRGTRREYRAKDKRERARAVRERAHRYIVERRCRG
jgi:hypothetical protein